MYKQYRNKGLRQTEFRGYIDTHFSIKVISYIYSLTCLVRNCKYFIFSYNFHEYMRSLFIFFFYKQNVKWHSVIKGSLLFRPTVTNI